MNGQERSRLDVIEGKVDLALERIAMIQRDIDNANKTRDKMLDDHETRIRSNERWKYSLPIASVMTFAAFIGGKLT